MWNHFLQNHSQNSSNLKIDLCIYRAFPDVGINIDIKNCDPRLVAAVDQLIRKFGREDRENTDMTFLETLLVTKVKLGTTKITRFPLGYGIHKILRCSDF